MPKLSLLTIYKTFIRSQLDYPDIIYDEAYNSALHDKLESIQYNACLAITGAIRGSSRETIYQEVGFESLNPIQDGLFWGCSRTEGTFSEPLPKICHAYPTMTKLGTAIP